jgi:hypothetical protein
MTGGSILSISIDPNLGGACEIEGGSPSAVLFAGYTGSILWGSTLVLGGTTLLILSHYPTCERPADVITPGWNLLVAKILSFCIALGLLLPLSLVRDKLYVIGNSCMSEMPWAEMDVTLGQLFSRLSTKGCSSASGS